MLRTITAALVLTALSIISVTAGVGAPAQQGAMPLRHRPVHNLLPLRAGELAALEVSPAFTYVGGQRFVLGGAADAEQHLFVLADANKRVQRVYWIQIEELLPTRPGAYNYSADSTVTVYGLPFALNIRQYTTAPDSGSDRARAFALLHLSGYDIPEGAIRARLVYLPDSAARREIMIVYLEPPSAAAIETAARAALVARATVDFVVHPRP